MMKPADFAPRPDKVPPGWKSCAQWAVRWKLSIAQTSRLLRQGVKDRAIRRRFFRARTGATVRPVPHYAAA